MTPVTHRVESAGLSAAFDARRGSGEGSVARLPYLVLAGRDHTGTMVLSTYLTDTRTAVLVARVGRSMASVMVIGSV